LIRSENIRLFFIGLGIVAIQIVLLRHLEILGAESDLVLLFLLWLAAKKSKTKVLMYAAFLGFLQDALTDLWGLNMFSKTVLIFILYGYLNRISQNRFLYWQIFLIILMAAFLHNLIFYGVSLFTELYSGGHMIWSLLIVSSIFTAIVGSFLHMVRVDI
jgi:rod shape-determining protein MreD